MLPLHYIAILLQNPKLKNKIMFSIETAPFKYVYFKTPYTKPETTELNNNLVF